MGYKARLWSLNCCKCGGHRLGCTLPDSQAPASKLTAPPACAQTKAASRPATQSSPLERRRSSKPSPQELSMQLHEFVCILIPFTLKNMF